MRAPGRRGGGPEASKVPPADLRTAQASTTVRCRSHGSGRMAGPHGGTTDRHGEIVSTVAQCAPRGQEQVDGFDLANHGADVSVAAQGGTLEVGAGEFPLSTLEDAEDLCAAPDDARAEASDGAPLDDNEGSDETVTTESAPAPQQRGNGNATGGRSRQKAPSGSSMSHPLSSSALRRRSSTFGSTVVANQRAEASLPS